MRAALAIVVAAVWAAGCATEATPVLAADDGRVILEAACTSCHDLGGLDAYKGYYRAEQWLDLVTTMIEHGAKLDDRQVAVLVDYLTESYGPQSR
jgi:mono/diheme cytochrome c family protein